MTSFRHLTRVLNLRERFAGKRIAVRLLVLVYIVQLAVLAPLHAREETEFATLGAPPAAEGRGGASATSAPGPEASIRAGHALPCSNPTRHHHRPLPGHNEASCPVCAAASHAESTSVTGIGTDRSTSPLAMPATAPLGRASIVFARSPRAPPASPFAA